MKNSNLKFTISYLRDSGGEEQDLSIEQQEVEVRKFCAENNYQLSRIFRDEAQSGSSTVNRLAFLEMVNYLTDEKTQEKTLIIWKFSRFARSIDDAQYYKAMLRRSGVEIISMKDTIPEGINGRFFESAIDWMNQRFLEDLSADVKRGLRHNVLQYGAVPGTPPRGFKREPVDLGKRRDGKPHIIHKWVPDPDTWEIAKLAWSMRAEGASYLEIREATGDKLYKSTAGMNRFFTNPIYRGTLHYGDEIIEDYCEPLVDESTWNIVQKIQKARSLKAGEITNSEHPRRKSSSYLLSGMLHCAQCGALMNGDTSRSVKRNHVGHFYVCRNKKLHRGCTAQNLHRDNIEALVIDELITYLNNPDNIAEILKHAELITNKDNGSDLQVKIIQEEIRDTKRKIGNLVAAVAEHGHYGALADNLKSLEKYQKELESRLEKINKVHYDLPLEFYKDFGSKITKALRKAGSDSKRKVLRGLIDHIIIERTDETIRGMVYFFIPSTPMGCAPKGTRTPV